MLESVLLCRPGGAPGCRVAPFSESESGGVGGGGRRALANLS